MGLRIAYVLILLLSVLFAPFWLSTILGIIGIIYFPVFWEVMFVFLVSDLVYGVREERFFGIAFISTIVSVIVFIFIEIMKKRVEINPRKL